MSVDEEVMILLQEDNRIRSIIDAQGSMDTRLTQCWSEAPAMFDSQAPLRNSKYFDLKASVFDLC